VRSMAQKIVLPLGNSLMHHMGLQANTRASSSSLKAPTSSLLSISINRASSGLSMDYSLWE